MVIGAHVDVGLEFQNAALCRDIIEHCADAILILSADQRITYINKAAEIMFGRPIEASIGKPLDILIPAGFKARHRALFDGFRDSSEMAKFMGRRGVDILGLRADGTEFPVSISILKSLSGADAKLVAIVRDVSEHKKLEGDLRKLASTDSLTGILNRRTFLQRTEEECARSLRHGNSLSLAMVDIDHFKRINDRFGHQVGDQAIRHVVGIVVSGLRKPDVLGRWGGEEFTVILPETDEKAAVITMERLRQRFEDTAFVHEASLNEPINLTVSIGVVEFRPGQETADDLINRADRALYAAKHAGRNKVCSATD
ncbi:MAG: GGDEF domain-containing protein [Alphaproteobacteria bacterium]|nr:GGDEF domain-containing protein [Alphaproteobacteria bacterium]